MRWVAPFRGLGCAGVGDFFSAIQQINTLISSLIGRPTSLQSVGTLSPSKSHRILLMELLMKAIRQFSVLQEKLFWREVIQTSSLLKKKEKRKKKKEGYGLAGLARDYRLVCLTFLFSFLLLLSLLLLFKN